MKNKKIACLITGVPKNFERCIPTLIRLLEGHDVTYFCVMREEFASSETLDALNHALGRSKFIVVPKLESDKALSNIRSKIPLRHTVLLMWHEILAGAHSIPEYETYDLIFRTRYDIFFHDQLLPNVDTYQDRIFIPEQLSWSGTNDMLCLAPPKEFNRYANTFSLLDEVRDEIKVAHPEAMLNRSLTLSELDQCKLTVNFLLYRAELFNSLSDVELSALSIIEPRHSAYKIGEGNDNEKNRQNLVEKIKEITRYEKLFPIYANEKLIGSNFYLPETDKRDGTVFRWMAVHAYMFRVIRKGFNTVAFTVHYHIKGWEPDRLHMTIDGIPVALKMSGRDEHGRALMIGDIPPSAKCKHPWSKITFSSSRTETPSQTGANPKDTRALSFAIGVPRFF